VQQNKQTRINLYTNLISLAVSVLLGVYYTPYLVRTLGIAAYGIVPLALIINQYINVVTGSLTGSLTRFYTISLQKNDYNEASRYLSTSLIVILLIFVCLLPVLFVFVTKINSFFNIPVELIHAAKILFAYTIASFFLSIVSSIINITLYALNRLDLMNYIKIVRIAFKFIIVILFFETINADVSYIGYANFLTELFVLIMSICFFLKTKPSQVAFSFGLYEKKAFVAVMGMTVWSLVHQIGDMGLYRTDSVLINNFWSTTESGILGAFSELGTYVMLIVSIIATLFGPLILIEYSKGNHKLVQELTLDNSLIVGVLGAIIVGVVIACSESIIKIWLGAEFTSYNKWFILKLITIPYHTASGVYAFTIMVWNKVKIPAIIAVIIGVLNVLILYLLFRFFYASPYIIEIGLSVSALLIIIQSYFLNSLCFNHIYNGNLKIIITIFIKILLAVVISFFISKIPLLFLRDTTPFILCGIGVSFILSFGVVYLTVFNKIQKRKIINLIYNKND
jgi:membrane protein EpsK